jgi:predicted membrane protein
MLGIMVVYNKKIYSSILLSFIMTIISFSVLVINEFYFFAVIYGIIDVYTKIYLLIYFINKKSMFRSVKFKKRKKTFNIVSALVIAVFFSISIGLKREILGNTSSQSYYKSYKYELNEIVILAIIISLFAIAGYVTKSKRWKKLD